MSTLTELPHIPLEVAENVIDQLSRDVESLCSCSLTCHGWLPRARYHLMASIRVQSREELYSICDYFRLNPRMATFVAHLSVSPAYASRNPRWLLETIPVALLSRLPNLRSYRFRGVHAVKDICFHATTLIHIKAYLHVEELTLAWLKCRAFPELARLLIVLPQLRRLDCKGMHFQDNEKTCGGAVTGITRFRDKCKCLSDVTIESSDVRACHLITQMSASALQFLRYDLKGIIPPAEDGGLALDLSEFKHLRSLEIIEIKEKTGSEVAGVVDVIIQILGTALPSTLHCLTMTFTWHVFLGDLAQAWSDRTVLQKCQLLEDVIIGLGTLRLVVWVKWAKQNRLAFWSELFCSCFPRLNERRLLQVQCSSVDDVDLGHDASVTAAAASLDGRFVATSAEDDTIIIWDGMSFLQTALIEIQCPEHGINALAFSDTGDFLAAMTNSKYFIWRIADGSLVTSIQVSRRAISCSWRSDGLDYARLFVLGATKARYGSIFLSIVRAPIQLPEDGPVHAMSSPAAFSPPEEVILDDSDYMRFPQLSPSGRTIAGVSHYSPGCHIWRMVQEPVPAYGVHYLTYRCIEVPVWPYSMSLVGDDLLVVGFSDGTICWWDISVFPLATKEPRGVLTLHFGGSDPDYAKVTSLFASPHHTFLLAYSDQGLTVHLLRREDLGGGTHSGLNDVKISLHVSLQGHAKPVTAACFSPCERYVATATEEPTVRLWSTEDGSLLWTFEEHQGMAVTHIVFTPDGKSLLTADEAGTVCMRVLGRFVRGHSGIR